VSLVVEFELGIEHLGDCEGSLNGLGDVIHVLRLDQGLEIVLEDLGEVVLKL
jgi:hypothetical protein